MLISVGHSGRDVLYDLSLDLVVCVEDMLGLGLAGTYLDDPSYYYELTSYGESRIARVIQAAAQKNSLHLVACYNICEGKNIYNCSLLIGPDGNEIGRYRKVHLPSTERWLNTAGDEFPVFETSLHKIQKQNP